MVGMINDSAEVANKGGGGLDRVCIYVPADHSEETKLFFCNENRSAKQEQQHHHIVKKSHAGGNFSNFEGQIFLCCSGMLAPEPDAGTGVNYVFKSEDGWGGGGGWRWRHLRLRGGGEGGGGRGGGGWGQRGRGSVLGG